MAFIACPFPPYSCFLTAPATPWMLISSPRPRPTSVNLAGNDTIELFGVATTPIFYGRFSDSGMKQPSFEPNEFPVLENETATLVSLLRRCGKLKDLSYGRRVHAHICSTIDHNTFVGNCLIQMYGNCGSTEDARAVFDSLPAHDLHSWNILINAYARNGRVESAKSVFSRMPERDIVSWNAMIATYAHHGRDKEALELFQRLQIEDFKPDQFTFVSALDACTSLAVLKEGQELHAAIVESGYEGEVIVATALVNMYGKSESLDDAKRVFGKMPQRDLVAWNAMIMIFSQNGHGKEGLNLFLRMQLDGIKPNQVTFLNLLDACTCLATLREAKEIHATIVECGYEREVVMGTALISMYGKCGSLEDAMCLFDRMPQHNVVTWSAVIAASAQNGHDKEALDFLHQMQLEGMKPDQITLISALDACTNLAALEKGQEIHATVVDRGYEGMVVIKNAIINMYGKCGKLENARRIFHSMHERDVVSWNIIITTCAQNGHGNEALEFFDQMQLDGTKPNGVTFLGVLTACSHTGQIYDARHYFVSMSHDHGILPVMDHYVCMIDLLGRAGHLGEAEDLIDTMPLENTPSIWSSLLSACRIHGDMNRGAHAATQFSKLDPKNAAPFVILSSIYAANGISMVN